MLVVTKHLAEPLAQCVVYMLGLCTGMPRRKQSVYTLHAQLSCPYAAKVLQKLQI